MMKGPSLEKGRGCVGSRVVTNGCLWKEVGKVQVQWVQGPGVRAQALFPSWRSRLSLDAFGWACRGPRRCARAHAVGLAGVDD